MSLTHYTVPIPTSATICPDWPTLCAETRTNWPHSVLRKKHGGYVIEDHNAIVLVCTADLCAILEEKDRAAQQITFHDPASGNVSVANYTVALPSSAKVCSDWPSLRAAAMRWPEKRVERKYGGFVIEEDGVVVVACNEKLSGEAEANPEQLLWIREDVVAAKG